MFSKNYDTVYSYIYIGDKYIPLRTSKTFTIDETPSQFSIRLRIKSGVTVNELIFKPQLEKGTVATPYEKYKNEQHLKVSLQNGLSGIPVKMNGNYTDENNQQWICDEINGTLYIRIIETVTINGREEGWTRMASGTEGKYMFCLNIPNVAATTINASNAQLLCEAYKPSVSNCWYGKESSCYLYTDSFRVYHEGITNVEDYKAWCRENPYKIMYIRNYPVETRLSDEEISMYKKLQTYKPTTIITNDEDAYMQVDYAVDIKTYIEAENKKQLNNKADKDACANVLKGNSSGKAVLITDISPVEHNVSIKVNSETIDDISTVKVMRYGKNIFDVFNQTYTSANDRCLTEVLENGTLRLTNKKLSNYTCAGCRLPYHISNFINKTITVSFKTNCSNNDLYAGLAFRCENADGTVAAAAKEAHAYGSSEKSITLTITQGYLDKYDYIRFLFYTNATNSVIGEIGDYVDFEDIQLEISDSPTEYKECIAEEYAVNKDGTVDGAKSIYPTMTLLTDTGDAVIETQYNRDTNKVIEQLTNAIISLGGNV